MATPRSGDETREPTISTVRLRTRRREGWRWLLPTTPIVEVLLVEGGGAIAVCADDRAIAYDTLGDLLDAHGLEVTELDDA
jgi:hypothetical protein